MAHSLKGAVATFAAQTAYAFAYELETMGRHAELDDAPSILQQQEDELVRIVVFVAKAKWPGSLRKSEEGK